MTRLELIRRVSGYSQRDVELAAGCARGTLNRMEGGYTPKKITSAMERLGAFLDVDPEDLLEEVERGDMI